MIKLTATQITQVVVDTVRLTYVEMDFDQPRITAFLNFGSTDVAGVFTMAERKRVDIDSNGSIKGTPAGIDVTALASVLSTARNAIEALLQGDSAVVPAGAQVSEAIPVDVTVKP